MIPIPHLDSKLIIELLDPVVTFSLKTKKQMCYFSGKMIVDTCPREPMESDGRQQEAPLIENPTDPKRCQTPFPCVPFLFYYLLFENNKKMAACDA